jgi:hypothetical protein
MIGQGDPQIFRARRRIAECLVGADVVCDLA